MADRKRIVHGRIITAHGVEIRSQQKAGSAGHRCPEVCGGIRLREQLAVRARHARACPRRIGSVAAARDSVRPHLITPVLAAVIVAAVDEIARGGAERIVGLAEGRDPSIVVVIDADIEPDLGHPLGVSHRSRPRSSHFLRRTPATLDYAQRIDKFALPIGAAARLVPGERGQRRKYRAHMVLLHQRIAIGGFDAPQRQQRAALDAVVLFDPRKQRLVFSQRFLAGDDTPFRDAAIDVLPNLLVELRLISQLIEHGHVRFDAAHHPRPGRLRNSLGERVRAKGIAPVVEAGRRDSKGGERMREQDGRTDARSEKRAARHEAQGGRSFHRNNVAGPPRRGQSGATIYLASLMHSDK